MMNVSLTGAEKKLAELIWRNTSISSPNLVLLANKELGWKKSTTYTVLKKLCDKGVFINENANVSIILSYDELVTRQSQYFIEDTFKGSFPKFITSFIGGKKLTNEQAIELRRLIDEYEGGDKNG